MSGIQHNIIAFISIALVTALFAGGFWMQKNTTPAGGTMHMAEEDPFSEISITAHAAFVKDLKTGRVLFAQNAEAQLPLASLAKVMTALVVEEELAKNSAVSIPAEAITKAGDNGLLVGETWRTQDLIDFTLVESSNDGASALATAVVSLKANAASQKTFAALMNARVATLGLSQTYFINETGLDVSGGLDGAYGSAQDIAALFAYILTTHPHLLHATAHDALSFTSLDNFTHTARNTNKSVASIPGIVASKTGFTDLAGGNLAIIFEAGPIHPIVAVVLGSTPEERERDIHTLVYAALHAVQQ